MFYLQNMNLLKKITTPEQLADVENYIKLAASKSDLERTELSKEKTGVFTGSYAINPVNNKKNPYLDFRLCFSFLWYRCYNGCSCT